MKDENKTKKQVIGELVELRRQVADLQAPESGHAHAQEALLFTQFSLDRAAVAAFRMGPDARFQYVNDAACRSLGYSRDELLSMTVHDVDPLFPAEAWPAHWKEVKERGSFAFESRHRAKDGTEFPVEVTVNFLEFGGNEYNFAFAQNITERKRVEEALRESEARYRDVVENSLTGVVIHQDGKLLYVNRLAAGQLGYKVEELVGTEYVNLVHPDDRAELVSFARAREREEDVPARHEWRFVAKDGKTRWAEVLAARTIHQARPAVFVNAVDITERKEAEGALREREEFNFALFEYNPIQTIVVDREGKVIRSNLAKRESGDKLPQLGDVMYKDYAAGHEIDMYAELMECIESGTSKEFPEQNYADKWLSIKIAPFSQGAIITSQDITDRKRAEEALRNNEEELRLTFDSALDAIFWANPETGLIINCNKAAETLVERTRDEVVGQHQTIVHPPEKGDYYAEMFRRHIEENGAVDDEAEVITKSGVIKPVHITASVAVIGERPILQGIFHDITGRKRVEDGLKESEEQFRGVTERSLTAIVIHQEGKLAYVNPRAAELLGYERVEMEGADITKFLHPDDQAEILSVARAREKGEDVAPRHEWRFLTKDGGAVWVDLMAVRTMYRSRPAVFINAVDISDRKWAEGALREREEKYRTILESIEEGYFEVDLAGNFTFANPSMCRILGYARKELLGMNNRSYTSPETAEKMYQIFNTIYRTGKPATVLDYELIGKDGSTRILELSASLMRDQSGEPAGFRGVARDVTDRQQAERDLRESEEKFRNVTEKSLTSIVVYQEGRIVYCNPAGLELLGYEASELEGEEITMVVRPEDRAEIVSIARAREAGEDVPPRREWQLVRKNGTTVWVDMLSVSTVFQGKPAVFLNGIDITERKRMEEEIMKARKLESLGVLAGGIAHDFNNMLTAVLGNISFAKHFADPENSKLLRRLAEAEKASLRARDLTQQLLTFSRGGAPIKETVSLVELLKGTSEFALSGSNVVCEFSILDDLWPVDADQGQISQVIENLIINANQAMPEGGTIQVRAENVTVGTGNILPLVKGQYVKVSVTDHGLGIPKEHLLKLFDPYFTTKQEGSGLGLATAYSIIKKHGGYITADSELGVGTTVNFYLPASEKPVPAKEGEEERLPVGEGKVLVMDDEDSVREVAGDMLAQMGYEVAFAKDGAEAIELYKKANETARPFDAVIMDLTVPGGMGGKEALQALVAIDPEVKAIVSSGYSKDPVMAEFRKHGFKGVVAKPYRIQELGRALDDVLKRAAD